MYGKFQDHLQGQLNEIEQNGLFKKERVITTPMDAVVKVNNKDVIIFCANNYLGLSSHPKVIEGAKKALDTHGFGMSSVRFICGTEDTILYAAAFDANGGVFEPLFDEQDAIISDELNHASIIDGVRLCKAQRYRYKNCDMADLEEQLIKAQAQRYRIIVTDGVFSMDGFVAPLDKICDLADKYNALVMVDECHASGFIGKTGRGTIEAKNVIGRVDIVTGTLGKALGGAMGGFTSGKKEIIELLRQRSRPYLFSNSLAPSIVGASLAVFDILSSSTDLRDKLEWNVNYFKKGMKAIGLEIKDGDSAIVPVMLYDAKLAQTFAAKLLDEGIYVIGFFFPVVPKDKARIRVQLSAAHNQDHLDKAIKAFEKVGKELGVIK
jgi:glycine C-acetyltransferase